MRFDFRTVLVLVTLIFVSFIDVSESAIIRKAKPVRVLRQTAPVRTHLPDGTKFEKYAEKGDELPPLPLGEEEVDDLNDPRIGHLDKAGEIAVPVDKNGKVLPGYEYLLKPITITIDLDEKDENGNPKFVLESPGVGNQDASRQQDYDPYQELFQKNKDQQNQPQPKPDFLPEQETVGEEYDDVPSDPQEPVPRVPDLPKSSDYTDSRESDEDMKVLDEEEEEEKEKEVEGKKNMEVIVPSIEIQQPIVTDNVEEKDQAVQEVAENVPEVKEESDKSVDVPKRRYDYEDGKIYGDSNESVFLDGSSREEWEGLSDAEVEMLAEDLRKGVFENVMKKAKEFERESYEEWKSSKDSKDSKNSQDLPVDPNSIVSKPKFALLPDFPRPEFVGDPVVDQIFDVVDVGTAEAAAKALDDGLDGVVLSGQDITDEEAAAIVAESLKPEPEPEVVIPNVRGARIGEGVKPDSASQYNIVLQILTVSMALLFL